MKGLLAPVVAVLTVVAAGAEDRTPRAPGPPHEVPGAPLVLRRVDSATKTVVVMGSSGREQVFSVDDAALGALSRLSPGDRVLVSFRFNRDARVEVILRGVPPGETL